MENTNQQLTREALTNPFADITKCYPGVICKRINSLANIVLENFNHIDLDIIVDLYKQVGTLSPTSFEIKMSDTEMTNIYFARLCFVVVVDFVYTKYGILDRTSKAYIMSVISQIHTGLKLSGGSLDNFEDVAYIFSFLLYLQIMGGLTATKKVNIKEVKDKSHSYLHLLFHLENTINSRMAKVNNFDFLYECIEQLIDLENSVKNKQDNPIVNQSLEDLEKTFG